VHIATYKTINYFFDKLMSAVLYMYRFLKKCKGYVRTKSHPEGSIMEGSMLEVSQLEQLFPLNRTQ
jgi:hypothetical protein